MTDHKELFKSLISHNVEVHDEYICLFDGPSKRRIKFIKLRQKHIDEAKAAREAFDFDSLERVAAFEQIVDSRVGEWSNVMYPSDFIEAFEDNVSRHPSSYEHRFKGGFAQYLEEYERYWDGCGDDASGTPFDEEPDYADLRDAYERFVKRYSDHQDT